MRFEQGLALVVGVANYAEVPALPPGVANDARAVANLLRSERCGYPAGNVSELIDEAATLDGIRDGLEKLRSEATSNDTVIVFFSGHGVSMDHSGRSYGGLVPYDCSMADIEGTILSEGELSEAMKSINAGRLLVVLDACHAGNAVSLKGLPGSDMRFAFDEKSIGRLAHGTGRVVMASCRGTETSVIQNGAPNSVFTEAFLDGMRGGACREADGLVRVFELFSHVAATVRRTVPGRQHPVLHAADLEDSFPVAMASGDHKSILPTVDRATAHRGLIQIMPELYPMGPMDQEIWSRAGGDPSLLKQGGNGRAAWFSALRLLDLGGGGRDITKQSLVEAALSEFPHHRELTDLLR